MTQSATIGDPRRRTWVREEQISGAYARVCPAVVAAISAHGADATLEAILRVLEAYRTTLSKAVAALPPQGRA
jgi:hypothetical protein